MDIHRDKLRSLEKSSLGDLTTELHTTLFTSPSEHEEVSENLIEPRFAFALTIEAEAESVRRRKNRLLLLVRERNRLVHTDLIKHDLDSPDGCERLARLLDEQNVRICDLFDELKRLFEMRTSAANTPLNFLRSMSSLRV